MYEVTLEVTTGLKDRSGDGFSGPILKRLEATRTIQMPFVPRRDEHVQLGVFIPWVKDVTHVVKEGVVSGFTVKLNSSIYFDNKEGFEELLQMLRDAQGC